MEQKDCVSFLQQTHSGWTLSIPDIKPCWSIVIFIIISESGSMQDKQLHQGEVSHWGAKGFLALVIVVFLTFTEVQAQEIPGNGLKRFLFYFNECPPSCTK